MTVSILLIHFNENYELSKYAFEA